MHMTIEAFDIGSGSEGLIYRAKSGRGMTDLIWKEVKLKGLKENKS